MKKVMISQPMTGKSEEEILAVRKAATEYLEKLGYEVVNTWFRDERDRIDKLPSVPFRHVHVHFLAMSLEAMAACDMVYFCKGWKDSRGCQIEHETARLYGVDCIYEN